jgi:hypothetical protein
MAGEDRDTARPYIYQPHQHVVSERLRESLCGAESLKRWPAVEARVAFDTLFDTLAVENAPTNRTRMAPV